MRMLTEHLFIFFAKLNIGDDSYLRETCSFLVLCGLNLLRLFDREDEFLGEKRVNFDGNWNLR